MDREKQAGPLDWIRRLSAKFTGGGQKSLSTPSAARSAIEQDFRDWLVAQRAPELLQQAAAKTVPKVEGKVTDPVIHVLGGQARRPSEEAAAAVRNWREGGSVGEPTMKRIRPISPPAESAAPAPEAAAPVAERGLVPSPPAESQAKDLVGQQTTRLPDEVFNDAVFPDTNAVVPAGLPLPHARRLTDKTPKVVPGQTTANPVPQNQPGQYDASGQLKAPAQAAGTPSGGGRRPFPWRSFTPWAIGAGAAGPALGVAARYLDGRPESIVAGGKNPFDGGPGGKTAPAGGGAVDPPYPASPVQDWMRSNWPLALAGGSLAGVLAGMGHDQINPTRARRRSLPGAVYGGLGGLGAAGGGALASMVPGAGPVGVGAGALLGGGAGLMGAKLLDTETEEEMPQPKFAADALLLRTAAKFAIDKQAGGMDMLRSLLRRAQPGKLLGRSHATEVNVRPLSVAPRLPEVSPPARGFLSRKIPNDVPLARTHAQENVSNLHDLMGTQDAGHTPPGPLPARTDMAASQRPAAEPARPFRADASSKYPTGPPASGFSFARPSSGSGSSGSSSSRDRYSGGGVSPRQVLQTSSFLGHTGLNIGMNEIADREYEKMSPDDQRGFAATQLAPHQGHLLNLGQGLLTGAMSHGISRQGVGRAAGWGTLGSHLWAMGRFSRAGLYKATLGAELGRYGLSGGAGNIQGNPDPAQKPVPNGGSEVPLRPGETPAKTVDPALEEWLRIKAMTKEKKQRMLKAPIGAEGAPPAGTENMP